MRNKETWDLETFEIWSVVTLYIYIQAVLCQVGYFDMLRYRLVLLGFDALWCRGSSGGFSHG